jgi:diguanylate cyclase (GGDEF)-like protein
MRAAIAETTIDIAGLQLPVTASVGVAVHEPTDEAKCLFDKADRALYRAKHNGRNRVEFFSPVNH